MLYLKEQSGRRYVKILKDSYSRQQFNPGLLGIFINPFYFARKGLFENISKLGDQLAGRLLDVGCGSKPYKSLFHVNEYVGLEIETVGEIKSVEADVLYDGSYMPFSESYFDCILCNQVLEHVFNPTQFLKELNRVVRTDGLLLLTVPFVWDEHEQPYDYARYSSFGLIYLLKENGFTIIEHKKTNNGIEAIFQLLNAYLYKVTYITNPYLRLLITLIIHAPINIMGLVLSKLLPRNNDLYLDNIILAKKI